jgi:hypothetical protein
MIIIGGLSTFYNTYGLAMDSITRYQVVLPNGSIVNATPTEHGDLYKGLKGGLSNFGKLHIQILFLLYNHGRAILTSTSQAL